MIRVLDLFAGTQSVKKALTTKYQIKRWIFNKETQIWSGNTTLHKKVEYIGVDICSPEDENMILDLAKEYAFYALKQKLGNWKPDFIWASPVCNKLSLATAMKGGHNPYFRLNKEKQEITPWKIGSMCEGAKNYQSIIGTKKAHEEALFTLRMFKNTKTIINAFKVPFAIENPRHSLTKYIMKEYIINHCSYCMYGFPQQKNTQIFSNKELNLKTCKHKRGSHSIGVYGKASYKNKTLIKKYSNRAAVPPKLINEIFSQLDEVKKW